MHLARRAWVPETCEAPVQDIAAQVAKAGAAALLEQLAVLLDLGAQFALFFKEKRIA